MYNQHSEGIHPHIRCWRMVRALFLVWIGAVQCRCRPHRPSVPDDPRAAELRLDESGLVIAARTTATQASWRVCGRHSARRTATQALRLHRQMPGSNIYTSNVLARTAISAINEGIDVEEFEACTEKNSTNGPSGCVASTRKTPEAISGW